MWLFARTSSRKGGAPLGLVVIVLLVLAWAVVLGPAFLRPRFEASPEAGIRDFERTLGILAGTRHGQQPAQVPGRWVMVPKDLPQAPRRRRNRVIRRRRQMLGRLLVAAGATLVLGLFPQMRALLLVHLGIDVIVAGYVLYLRRRHMLEQQQREVVRPIAPEEAAPAAATTSYVDALDEGDDVVVWGG